MGVVGGLVALIAICAVIAWLLPRGDTARSIREVGASHRAGEKVGHNQFADEIDQSKVNGLQPRRR